MSYSDLANLVTFRPLERPVGHGPTRYSPFRASWSNTVSLLGKELRAHGARQTVLEVDLRDQDIRLDGLPRADRNARTPGIVLSFKATRVPDAPDLRYEVLRRDDFACRYCGATASDAKLTVDHVQPVALGGSDDASNLVTACQECNAGKSSTTPDAPIVSGVADDALRWAAAIKKAAEIQASDRAAVAEFCEMFGDAWGNWYALPNDWKRTVEGWYNAGVEKEFLLDCIDIAFAAKGVDWRWKYFCGIVWRRLDERHKIASDLIANEEAENNG